MIKVVGISFKNSKKIYNFLPNNLEFKLDEAVICETEQGEQLGFVKKNIYEITDDKIKETLSIINRKATKEDLNLYEKNRKDEKNALAKCRELATKNDLNMYVVDASFNLNRSQLIFKFISDNRVDFRNLAKDLANIYKARIELRQIGVRDRAKEVSGFGLCGQVLCCSKFMNDFDSVSINMAKNQNIALNPNKINGVCGRLLCCLKYENECYRECRKDMPQLNKKIKTDKGEGKVISIDVLKRSYKVNIPDVGIVEYVMDSNESN